MRNVTILGAGRVGSAIALDLARDGEFQATVADRSEPALDRLRTRGLGVRRVDLGAPEGVREAVAGADLVVGAVPGFLGFRTLEAVLEAGKVVLEGLCLDGIEAGRYELICLPLRIKDCDGSPVRALLRRA